MRLTEKLKPPYERVIGEDYVYTSGTRLTPSFAKVEQKLGQLEDIEDKLGIDLIIFFNNYRELLSLKGRNLKISIEEMQKELEQL